MNKSKEEALALIEKIGCKLTTEDKELEGKQLLKVNYCWCLLVVRASGHIVFKCQGPPPQ